MKRRLTESQLRQIIRSQMKLMIEQSPGQSSAEEKKEDATEKALILKLKSIFDQIPSIGPKLTAVFEKAGKVEPSELSDIIMSDTTLVRTLALMQLGTLGLPVGSQGEIITPQQLKMIFDTTKQLQAAREAKEKAGSTQQLSLPGIR